MQIPATEDLQTPGFGQRPARRGPAYGLGMCKWPRNKKRVEARLVRKGERNWVAREKVRGMSGGELMSVKNVQEVS